MLRLFACTTGFLLLIGQAFAAEALAVKKPPLPPVREGRENPVDRLVDAYFAQHGCEISSAGG